MKRNSRAGITLLETMIALAIMAMIAVILSSGLGSTARVFVSTGGVSQIVDQAKGRSDLRKMLENALPSTFPGQDEGRLRGSSSEMQFSYISDDGQFWPGDPVVISIKREDGGDVVLRSAGTDAKGQETKNQDQVLAVSSLGLELSYFGHLRPEDPTEWLDHWEPEAGLPELVRISITDDKGLWPPLTVRPGKVALQSEISLSSALPPSLPSRP
jgi:Prokaryotic N-terminal methylation motif